MKGITIAAIGIGVAVAAALAVLSLAVEEGGTSEQMQSAPDTSTADSKIKVVASFYPLYEFSKNVAGDKADVSSFIPMGIEPHDWEPSTGDLTRLKTVDVFVYNGAGMEPFVEKLVDSGEYGNVAFVETIRGMTLLQAEEHEAHFNELLEEIEQILHQIEDGQISEVDAIESIADIVHHHEDDGHQHDELLEEIEQILHQIEDGQIDPVDAIAAIEEIVEHGDVESDHGGHAHSFEYDPHVWLDPVLAKQQVVVIRNVLVDADPANAAHYEENTRSYVAELDALDAKIKSELSDCRKDTIVPFHNAFGYVAKRYGFNVFALSGISPESEASAADLKNLVDFVKEHDIKVVFSEDLIDPRLAEVLAQEAGAQVLILSPLEGLSNEEISAGKTYLTKMEENISNLKVALECR